MRIEHRSEVRPDAPPVPVRVIGTLYMALGVLAAVMGIFVPTGVFILLLLQAVLLIAVGAGLVAGRLWAYYVAVVMAAFNSLTLFVAAITGTTDLVVPLSVNITALYWLLRRNVRQWAGLTSW